MPIDDDNIGQFVGYDTDTDEYTALAPLDESLELESIAETDVGAIERLEQAITITAKSAVIAADVYMQFKHAVLRWMFSDALQSGDRRKIKRAKRKYKSVKRELRRRLLQDDC